MWAVKTVAMTTAMMRTITMTCGEHAERNAEHDVGDGPDDSDGEDGDEAEYRWWSQKHDAVVTMTVRIATMTTRTTIITMTETMMRRSMHRCRIHF